MSTPYILHDILNLKDGDHLCCLYETEEEHQALLTPYLRHGLEQGQKVFYIVDAHTVENVLNYLKEDGIEIESYLENGQFSILTVNDNYMKDGVFDPDKMITLLEKEVKNALSEGYAALRVTGEMSWALKNLLGSERLIEYESKLNSFFPKNKCIAICQYDMRKFDSELLLNVLLTHPIAVIGSEIYQNFYYMPPEEFFGADPPAARLYRCMMNLKERKIAEEKLQDSIIKQKKIEEELHHKEKMAILGKIAGSIAHELRNPLSIINNSAYFLKMRLKNFEEKVIKNLNTIQKEVARSDEIITELIDFAKIEPLILEKGNVNYLIKEALSNCNIPTNITISLNLDTNLPPIMLDPIKIQLVFRYIISNAIQAMPNGGIIDMTTLARNDVLEIICRDTGMGIPKEDLPKIFEPLFSTKMQGMGLGLTIANGIVEMHEGIIEVESKVGVGSTFFVKLPIEREETL